MEKLAQVKPVFMVIVGVSVICAVGVDTFSTSAPPDGVLSLGNMCGNDTEGHCDVTNLLECSNIINGTCVCVEGFYNDRETPPNCHNGMVFSINKFMKKTYLACFM